MLISAVIPSDLSPELLHEIETASTKFSVLDYAPVGFCLLRQDFTVLVWNRCLENWTHIPSAQIVGSDLRQQYPNINQPKYLVRLRQVFEQGFPALFSPQLHQALIPCSMANGQDRIQQTTVTAVPLAQNQQERYALIAIQDVTELTQRVRKYQTELQERHRAQVELQRSNAELEQFAYVASHDLREPLRMVITFTQMLADEYEDKLDADALEMIKFAVDGAQRMEKLIKDLLAFSQVGTHGNAFKVIDSHTSIGVALQNLRLSIQESGVEIIQGGLPTIKADGAQIAQLFQNLLSNAIKYRRGPSPQIHINAESIPGYWQFSIQDNGIGLKSEHAERIFMLFQRLHPRETYPGTGIGLAICKKIVERHGGRIWVMSQLEQGATFYFTIPRQ